MAALWQLHRAFHAINKRLNESLSFLKDDERLKLRFLADGYQTGGWNNYPYRQKDAAIRAANRTMRLYRTKMTAGEWNRVVRRIGAKGRFNSSAIRAAEISNVSDEVGITSSDELKIPEPLVNNFDFDYCGDHCILGTQSNPCRICGTFLQYSIEKKDGTNKTVFRRNQGGLKGFSICKHNKCTLIFNTFKDLITSNDILPVSKIISYLASTRSQYGRIEQFAEAFTKNNGRFVNRSD